MSKRVKFVLCWLPLLGVSPIHAQSTFAPTTTEYDWSTSVNQLRMSQVHGTGILGRGVVVAVLDTGVNIQHSEFANSGRLLPGYNGVNGSTDVTDNNGHGTHVAGIVAASGDGTGMYGVAPGATLLPIKVFNGGTAPPSAVTAGLEYALAQNARVINLSLGTTSPTGDTGLKRVAATNNALVVIAAGNEGAASPNWPGRYAQESWANGTLIVVGSVNSQRRITSESNRAGPLAPFYLVAPGVNIISSYGSTYSYMTGTSMAAPAVSGAAALVTGYWPYLKANQVASILLKTADDLGAPGVDAIYGHGMLNVNRALAPVGAFRYRTMNGTITQIDLSTPGVRSTQPSISTPSSFQNITTEAFDDYGRNYKRNEGAVISGRTALTVDDLMSRSAQLIDATQTLLGNGGQVQALTASNRTTATQARHTNANQTGDPWNHKEHDANGYVAYQASSGQSLAMGTGGLSSLALGINASGWKTNVNQLGDLLQNPLTRFSPQHRFIALSSPLKNGWQLKGAALQAGSKVDKAAHGDIQLFELMHQTDRLALHVSNANLRERGLLGGYSNEAIGLNQQTQTQGWSMSAAMAMNRKWALVANWSSTMTKAPHAKGLLTSATDIRARSIGIGTVRSDWLALGDRVSLSWQTPLQATSGQLTYSVITEVDSDGTPSFASRTVELAPPQPQQTWDLRYTRPTSKHSHISTALSVRVHPDHDSQASTQWAWGIRYTLAL